MKKKNDVSIHFQTKTQTVNEINTKLQNWLDSDDYNGQFDFSERGVVEPRNVLHHCFLKEEDLVRLNLPEEKKKVIEDTFDFLETFSEDIARWSGVSDLKSLCWDRRLMLENLKKLEGIAIFLGEIKEGVEEEYKLAKELGIECILIP